MEYPFLFEELQKQEPEQMPGVEKEGDVEVLQDLSDEWTMYVRENVFGGIFKFIYDSKADRVIFTSNEGTNFDYPISKSLTAKAQGLAEKILLSKWAKNKRKQRKLYK